MQHRGTRTLAPSNLLQHAKSLVSYGVSAASLAPGADDVLGLLGEDAAPAVARAQKRAEVLALGAREQPELWRVAPGKARGAFMRHFIEHT